MAETPEQIVDRTIAQMAERLRPGEFSGDDGFLRLSRTITEAIYSAMAAEREACAKIAARPGATNNRIASAIRARGSK